MSEASDLKRDISIAQTDLLNKQRRLSNIQTSCQHNFTQPRYDPEECHGYTVPGDPPETMGVDWRGPQYVPSSSKPRWSRYCSKCDKTEYTYRTKKPSPSQGLPDFGDK